ncbi:MAG: hypothetical protein ACK5HL_00790 [Bacilli bacterium]
MLIIEKINREIIEDRKNLALDIGIKFAMKSYAKENEYESKKICSNIIGATSIIGIGVGIALESFPIALLGYMGIVTTVLYNRIVLKSLEEQIIKYKTKFSEQAYIHKLAKEELQRNKKL